MRTSKIKYQGADIDLISWRKKISPINVIKEVAGIDFSKITTDEEVLTLAKDRGA